MCYQQCPDGCCQSSHMPTGPHINPSARPQRHTHACTNTWVCSVICMHTHTQQAACSRPSLLVAVITPLHTGSRCHSQAKMRVGHPLHAQPLHTDTQTHRVLYPFTDLQIHQYVVLWTNATLSYSLRQFQNYIHMWMHNRVAVRKGLKLKLKCVSVCF